VMTTDLHLMNFLQVIGWVLCGKWTQVICDDYGSSMNL
jgi:hypothetical protein